MDIIQLCLLRDEIKRLTVMNCDGCNTTMLDDLCRDYGSAHQQGCCLTRAEAITRYLHIAALNLSIGIDFENLQTLEDLIKEIWDDGI